MSETKIKVGDKVYDIPDVDLAYWRKLIKRFGSPEETKNIFEEEGVDDAIEFFYNLLHPYNPEITKKALEKMPVHQCGALFIQKIISEILTPPLDSGEDSAKSENQENQ